MPEIVFYDVIIRYLFVDRINNKRMKVLKIVNNFIILVYFSLRYFITQITI